ncbi:MAG: tRNA (guanosine(46)-N7)-methyltransferase TrmB [Planctomycetes bacterium RBG_16_55_9]|nr:MAG: tRNA (guanosine(46)-N7)-methyltransferase TrmB [Planctomycetes bacterium RBG_16_55_9]
MLKDYSEISLKPEDFEGKVDFVRIFGRSGPVHVEVGSGKGIFLLNQGKAQPEINFLGIEWAGRYYRYAVDRIGRWGLTNVRIIRTDAAGFVAGSVPDSSVDCFHVYFPDPWPKKRHHKRRFLCPANVEHLVRCLKTAGQIRIATDHADYFEQIQRVIADQSDKLEEIDFIRPAGAEEGEWAGTNFERKYLKDQRPIYTLAVRKI